MIKKLEEKQIAISLRRSGRTYSQILEVVPIAKSTLSIWLKGVGMAKAQKQKFTEIKRLSGLRGGEARKKQRIDRQSKIFLDAKEQIKALSEYEFFILGVCLYWAEGTKEKEYRPGSQFAFSNMDPKMIILFLKWLEKVCKIPKSMIVFEIMVHESHKDKVEEVKRFWAKTTNFQISNFSKVYYKKSKIKKTNRKNTKDKYHGVLKIRVKKSSSLVRKIASWSDGLFEEVLKM